jgi:hypothetical protein
VEAPGLLPPSTARETWSGGLTDKYKKIKTDKDEIPGLRIETWGTQLPRFPVRWLLLVF